MQRLESDIERILNVKFYTDLDSVSTEELRLRKKDAEAIEAMVSYARRITQGRMEIFEYDPTTLAAEGSSADAGAVDRLGDVITPNSGGRPISYGRFVDVSISQGQIDEVEAQLLELIAAARTQVSTTLEKPTPDSVIEFSSLNQVETKLSEWRKQLFMSIDAIHAELVVRYRDDGSIIDSLLNKVIQGETSGD